MNVVAVPEAYRDDLAPYELSFVITTDDVDLTEATSVRALVQRSDGEVLEWTFEVADDPAPAPSAITVTRSAAAADFFNDAAEPIAPATYTLRFLVGLPAGELPLPEQWLSVEALF